MEPNNHTNRIPARKHSISGIKLVPKNYTEKMELSIAKSFHSLVRKYVNAPIGRYPDMKTENIIRRIGEQLPILLTQIEFGVPNTRDFLENIKSEDEEEVKEEDEEEQDQKRLCLKFY
jgi:hypothetical protein